MSLRPRRLATASLLAAACAMTATPAAAQDRYGRYEERRGGIDIGEVIGGVAVLGTIAAIATAVSRGSRGRVDERYPDQGQDYRYQTPQYQGSYDRGASGGLDRAADMCVAEVERGRERVASVDNVSRGRDGWVVSGQVASGTAYSCRIGNDGRIGGVDLGGYAPQADGRYDGVSGPIGNDDYAYANDGYQAQAPAGNGQWDDDAYARARSGAGVNDVPPLPQPVEGGWDSPDYDTGG